MKAAVGLFESGDRVPSVLARLKGTGFSDSAVRLVKSLEEMDQCMRCNKGAKVREDIVFAVLLGTFVFSIFGLLSSLGAINATGASASWAIGLVVMFVLIGALSGLFLGWVMGAANAEQEIQEFRDAVTRGAVVVMVSASEDRVNKASSVLRQEKAKSVRTCTPLEMPEAAPSQGHTTARA